MDIDKDFSRNVWCLLGLPFDAITLDQTATEILLAVKERRSCFLSTPNINFLCAAQTDNHFRESVINSDLSVTDGFPIVLVARLLRIPIPERVGGSNLIEYLYQQNTASPIKVFFFGGEPGVGALASQKINQKPAGLLAVGHYAPGFGSVGEMSTPEIIDTINQCDVEFLFVSLGAKKGQAWIEKNRHQLNAPVLGYLGAVINFFAGSVQRAPVLAQRLGLEWLWRIYQEPVLWRRYFADGMRFLGLLLCNVFPYWFWLKFIQPKASDQTVEITVLKEPGGIKPISLTGYCTVLTISPLREAFKKAATEKRDVILDLKNVTIIDSAFLGLCLVLYKHLKASRHTLKLINPNKDVRRILKWQKVNDLLAYA
jgi:N-acetylglucosaminyldiphosphoundecaprenol N-acetyl-beta-D-mannosaminyltransferase